MTVHGNGAGTLTNNMKTHVENYGDVWFDTNAIPDIVSLKNARNKFHVSYNNHKGEGRFVVHKLSGINVYFLMHSDGLHYHNTLNRRLTMVLTVKQESEGFSKR